MMPAAPPMHQCHQQRVETEFRSDREARGDQFVDAAPRVLERGPQIAARQVAEVGRVLPPQRLVEAVLRLQRRLDLGDHGLLAGERPARRRAHEEERRGDHHQQHRDGLQHARADEAPHAIYLPPRRVAATRT